MKLILNNFWSQIWVIYIKNFIYPNFLFSYIEMKQILKFSTMYHIQPWGEKKNRIVAFIIQDSVPPPCACASLPSSVSAGEAKVCSQFWESAEIQGNWLENHNIN